MSSICVISASNTKSENVHVWWGLCFLLYLNCEVIVIIIIIITIYFVVVIVIVVGVNVVALSASIEKARRWENC